MTLGRSVCLTPPRDGIEEPAGLRRSDGASVYRRVDADWYTSQRILGAEQRIVASAGRGGGRTASIDSVQIALLTELANGTELNAGQINLITGMATSGRRVQLAVAAAGTGKTTAMRGLSNAWLDSGGSVLALAPTAAAATQLGRELPAGVHADTLHKLAHEVDRPDPPGWVAALGTDTLVIIDEAGMADTLVLDRVIGRVLDLGGSVRLIGDDQQLGAIASGGVLRDIARQHRARRLDEVVRFHTPAEDAASIALRDGDPAALGFYLDHGRVHVGDVDTAVDGLFDAWLVDKRAGLDALMLAPTRDQVAALNARARDRRLDGRRPGREMPLSDSNQASAGDQIITRRNDRRLRVGDGWVQNGDRWIITKVGRDGSLGVRQQRGHRRATLPASYVAAHVELGYATTIHGAQGLTADTCHGLITGTEARQQAYTMLSRGRYANHAWVQVTGNGDPDALLTTETLTPSTATEILEKVLARDDSPVSAITQWARAHDPAILLGEAVDRYNDALRQIAAGHAGPELAARLDQAADATGIPLTDADAWPVAKGHLLVLHANGWDPFQALAYALQDPLGDARDPAAVIDHRLDVFDVRSRDTDRPLPWLPGVPTQLVDSSAGDYLARRRDLIISLTGQTRDSSRSPGSAPAWAAALGTPPNSEAVAEIEVWRAAHHVPSNDLRPTGHARHRLAEAREQHRLDALLAGESEAVLAWLDRIQHAAPDTIGDPSLIRAARECAAADPDGTWLVKHLQDEARRPLPDDHKADALRYRLDQWTNTFWETVEPKPIHDHRRDEHRPSRPDRGIPR
ncbi:MAG: AAA family ATPase [Propionicimonas sp.]